MFADKSSVINWFGDRGVAVSQRELKHWHWEAGTLWFVISSTEEGMVDVTMTHDEQGNPIWEYELYDSIPIAESPLANKK